MDIKACKQCIENKVNLHSFMIFQEADTDFISRQYIQERVEREIYHNSCNISTE